MILTKHENSALQALSVTFRGLVQARLQSPFKTLPKTKQTEVCHNAVSLLHSKTGDKGSTSPETIVYQTQDFQKEMVGKFADFTETEIYMACEGLYRGEFGQFFGLNAKTYHQLLKGFSEKPERGKAWLKYLELIDRPEVKEIPTEIKKQQGIEYLKNRFETYKKTGQMGYFGWADYDFLKELKGVKSLITLEQFKVIKEKTEEVWSSKYVKEMEKEKKRGNFDLANSIADILTKGIEKDKTLLNRQKELALKCYFDSVDSLEI